ncbi:NAD-dependent malic enzyme [Legionella taurinensis]|uniref:NAD-dependent malic enzyme n=1 Tax=Legionella taurinensis TaxID=70611 RepID=A0A3A5LF46_9GAMM|nr:NAD-dependent malic enzyme [Legionella taurinensis]MDX1837568.1 NAD-dependent malic enzyme [Legionella taurinensis]PUT40900.1 NAD-dependent malic enzyme [Legionella taurinensis]PUT41655.1 NAD-dependent malic enzyme [Legionella taurinensis]PUT44322.1 NAD-dependent malic enzyme [Legionella taurinensis]PUT48763.1 NAD-dependent malic enzyme [Legionella taurinensis]
MDYKQLTDDNGQIYYEVKTTDFALITNPILNKGSGFSNQERVDFKLFGLLPPEESNLAQQRARSYEAFKSKSSELEKYIYMRDLQDSNETLFYSLLCEHITEIMPIVYTPVVGSACQRFSHIYRRPRGLFISYPYRDKIDMILANPRFDNVKAIVVSDGERILGLGDQGAGGMGIPIGKLALYCACAGIHPASTLPVLLDTGTNNSDLLQDPLYMGWRHERVRDQEYDDFVDRFVQALKKRFPHILLQWEDFALQNATRLLNTYRDQLCTFNDDIQGTAAVATGTLFAAVQVTGIRLSEQRIVIVGAGSAGCGIAELIVHAMVEDGISEAQARSQIYMIDRNGLLLEGMTGLLPFQQQLLKPRAAISGWQCENNAEISLKDVIRNLHPNALLGVSGQPNLFTEELIREMAAHVERPIIMPLSNPISRSEAIPQDLIQWTDDRAVIGTGSPFGVIKRRGQDFRIDQTNNVYIFPGMGLGLIAVQARRVTDKMFMAAAKALASCSPALQNPNANLLPPLDDVREVSYRVALAVAKEAVKSELADYKTEADIEKCIRAHIWEPLYVPYRKPY